jgi:DNA-binding response OmpR family regulator
MKKIVIIEDDSLVIKILDFVFKKRRIWKHISRDGADGINQIDSYNLIITDIMMPYKSGLEITAYSKSKYLAFQ